MKALKWLDENLEKYVCVTLFALFTAIMIVNVFMRFIVKNAIPWASDLVLFIFIWFIWFAISYGFKVGSHVRVTILAAKLPKRAQTALCVGCNILTLAGFAILLVVGIQLLGHNSVVGKYGLLIKYPMWSLYLSTPIGLALCIIRLVQDTIHQIKQPLEGEGET